jgi:hypothetical protein
MDKVIENLCNNGNEQYVHAFILILQYLLFGRPNGVVVGSASPFFKKKYCPNDIDVRITGIPFDVLREKCANIAQQYGVIFKNSVFCTKNGKKVIDVVCIPFKKGIIPDIVYIEGIPTFNLEEIRRAYDNDRDEDADKKKDYDKKKYLDNLLKLSESKLQEMFDIKDTLLKAKSAVPESPITPKRSRESAVPESPITPKRSRGSLNQIFAINNIYNTP